LKNKPPIAARQATPPIMPPAIAPAGALSLFDCGGEVEEVVGDSWEVALPLDVVVEVVLSSWLVDPSTFRRHVKIELKTHVYMA
jgi:hypothetical protein